MISLRLASTLLLAAFIGVLQSDVIGDPESDELVRGRAFTIGITYYGSGNNWDQDGLRLSLDFADSIKYSDSCLVNGDRCIRGKGSQSGMIAIPGPLTDKLWLEFWTDTQHFADSILLPDSFQVLSTFPPWVPGDSLVELTWNRSKRCTKYFVNIWADPLNHLFDMSASVDTLVVTYDTTITWRIPKFEEPFGVDFQVSGEMEIRRWPEQGSSHALGHLPGLISCWYSSPYISFETGPREE